MLNLLILMLVQSAALPSAPMQGDARVVPPGGQVTPAGTAGEDQAVQVTPRAAGRPAVTQIDPQPRKAPASAGQVSSERRSSAGSPQLGRRDRSPQAAAPLSARSDGRPQGSAPIGGADRCDPAASDPRSPARCDRVIETRSAEFSATPAPTLSPEQRLLIVAERGDASGIRGAAQRVARNDIDSNAAQTQALAAITLAAPPVEAPKTPARPDATLPNGLDTILQVVIGLPVSPPK